MQVERANVSADLVIRALRVGAIEGGGEGGAERADTSGEHEEEYQACVVGGVADEGADTDHGSDAAGPTDEPADHAEQ